ncbi:MAG: penicillin-binding protein 1A [Gammaproteobacteria bacterium]|nr:penicillin-binding protein 1A [Gammaproteobacteria bacterium]
MKKTPYLWRTGIWSLISLGLFVSLGIGFLLLYLDSQLPPIDSLKQVKLQVPLRIYTQEGRLIQEYGEKRRIPVAFSDIPQPLIQGVLATEDQRYFEHSGVDFLGLGRAGIKMLKTGTKSQGGSTITMQVARNFFLSRKKTFLRKIQEILLAIKIDRELSKEKILELYLNKIYLGNRAYGVGAAAQIYYGKTLKELTISEMAMIAGLPQAPSTQNPIANPPAAEKRRNHVLERMFNAGYLSAEQYQQAIREPIKAYYHGAKIEVEAPYVAEMIRQSLFQYFGKSAYTKGYKVYTSIRAPLQLAANETILQHLITYDKRHGYRGPVTQTDLRHLKTAEKQQHVLNRYPVIETFIPALVTNVQPQQIHATTRYGDNITIPYQGFKWARRALSRGWYGPSIHDAHQVAHEGDVIYVRQDKQNWELAQIPEAEAALVALNPQNGGIEALVGGLDFANSKFNRATQSGRQPGSSFKPFIYTAALSKGYTLATLINDAPLVIYDPSQPNSMYRPHNYNHTFNGPTRLKEGLVLSKNLVSLRILDDIGIDYAIEFIQRFGFQKAALPKGLSLALGSLSVSPLDLTSAYAIFANGGFRIQPFLINEVTDNTGKVLLKAKPTLATDTPEQGHPGAPRVLAQDINFLMQTSLKSVIQEGSARSARILNRDDIAGKTGTTNDQVDAWFAGFHQDLAVTVWVGFDNPHSLHEYAADVALPLWIDFMKSVLPTLPHKPFEPPASIAAYPINKKTGLLAKSNYPGTIMEYFQKDHLPEGQEDTPPAETSDAPIPAPQGEINASNENSADLF